MILEVAVLDVKPLLLVRWRRLEDHTEGFRKSQPYQRWKALLAVP
jgi:hypothetical protein